MGNSFVRRARRSLAVVLTAGLLVAGMTALGAQAAVAAEPSSPPPLLQRDENVVTSDPIPTVQIDNGYVWAQTMIGSTVYAVGKFDNAREPLAAPGAKLTARSNVLAYDIETGQLLPFAPKVNGVVKAVAASPDGTRIYIGGSFNQVNGASRWNIAAIDARTGELVPGFAPSIGGSGVYALATSGETVYAGGLFTQGNGAARKNLAAFTAATGAVQPWAPQSDLQVDALVMDPAGRNVIVAGRFSQVNGDTAMRGVAAVDKITGGLDTGWALPKTVKNGSNAGTTAGKAGIFGLAADAGAVYGTGWAFAGPAVANLEGTFAAEAGTGAVRWIADCLGDHYGVYSTGKVVYTTSHTHACETMGMHPEQSPRTHRYSEAFTAEARGTLGRQPDGNYVNWQGTPAPSAYAWSPDWAVGTTTGLGQAGLSITGTGSMISIGGEFRSVNNGRFEGLVRFSTTPPGGAKDGPRLSASTWVPTARALVPGRVRVVIRSNWDRDDLSLTYELRRAGDDSLVATTALDSTWWRRAPIVLTDETAGAGAGQQYVVVARDGNGNAVRSQTVTAVAPSAPSAYADAVIADGPQLYYPMGGTTQDWTGANTATVGTGVTPTTANVAHTPPNGSSFSGTIDGRMTATAWGSAPGAFTTELWFKTETKTGGKLIGWGSSSTGNSGMYDRQLVMADDGRVVFATNGSGVKTVTSPTALNDGVWHHVVTSQSSYGMKLYVDGVLVATDASATKGQSFGGYWRVGGDSVSGYPLAPTSMNFQGKIDEVAVYPQALSADQVKTHFSIGRNVLPPAAAFTASSSGLDLTVDAAATAASGTATVSSYSWNWGDGSAAGSGAAATHAYAQPGTYTVRLTVRDSNDLVSKTERLINIPAPNTAPAAAFTASSVDLTASVDGSTSTDADGTIASYSWNWGDGAVSAGRTASHVFAAAGTYTVTLTVTDDRGVTHAATRAVTVTAPPVKSELPALAADEFERTAGPGWGATGTGGAWTIAGGSQATTSVSDGRGRMALAPGDTRHATLGSTAVGDAVLSVQFSVDQPSSTGGSYIGVIARSSAAGKYFVRAWLRPDGMVWLVAHREGTVLATQVVSGLTYQPNTSYSLKVSVTGSSSVALQAKVWATGSVEPAAWQLSTTDAAPLAASGAVGLSGNRSGSSTATLGVTFDSFRVTAPE
ncbi:PKD domain-containing protein [Microbacterium sp. LWO14-1.2]|uniref:PKD domain-containing protein n=1 Tax=Microbacterium sp. LWO14-1.2 TaxID=3135263 RepID=UPI003138840A